MMNLRSKFLVHWPGRDINEDTCDDDAKRDRYLERLRGDYVDGLFAKKAEEGTIRGVKLKRLVRLCFTEIRLSQAKTHADRYGKLGIGFERKYIINRGGRPVIYIPFEAKDKLMEETMRFVYENSNGKVRDRLKWLFAFVKRMSNKPTTHKDCEDYLEELEWRIVYGEKLDSGHFKRMHDATYRWRFKPEDVRLLVLPDQKAKAMALADAELLRFFRIHTPIMLTLEDCSNF